MSQTKRHLTSTTALLPLLLAPMALAPASVPTEPPASGPAATAQSEYEEFLKKFRQAMKVGDRQTMSRLFKSNQLQAITWVLNTCQRMATNPSDALAKDLQIQKQTWESAFNKSRFVSKMERFWAFTKPEVQGKINELVQEAVKLSNEGRGLMNDKAAENRIPRMKGIVGKATELAKAFEVYGDKYQAAEMWVLVADLSSPYYVDKQYMNLGLSLECYKKFLVFRDEIELVDENNKRVEKNIEDLEKNYGAVEGGGASPSAGLEVGGATSVPGTIELLEEPGDFQRPSILADETYLTWNVIWLDGPDGTSGIGRIKDGPRITRTGSGSISVEGSDGEVQEVSLNNRIQVIQTTVGRGDEQRPWAFMAVDTGGSEYFHDVLMNMAAGPEGLGVHVAPGAAQVYDVAGTPVRVFDDNLDGVYGGPPQEWVWPGMVKGESEVQLDSMLIGKSKRAVPFSTLVEIDDQWYQLEPEFEGATLRYAPATLRTGNVKLKAKGVDFAWYVIEGEDELEGVRFDLANAKRGVDVPVGNYHLVSAGVREGKKTNIQKAMVTMTKDPQSVTVGPDSEIEMQAGAPYGFDFEYELDGDELTVFGESVVVVGVGGERYHRIWRARAEPEVSLRKAGSGRGSKAGKMQAIWNQQDIIDIGQQRAWKPLDVTVDNKYGANVEVRLSEKNDLFGKIESVWIAPEKDE